MAEFFLFLFLATIFNSKHFLPNVQSLEFRPDIRGFWSAACQYVGTYSLHRDSVGHVTMFRTGSLSICALYACNTCRGQKRALDSLELELTCVCESSDVGAEN